jgi:hypothetical protein
MQSTYNEIKDALGGKDPEEVIQLLLKYIQNIKPKKILAATPEEENENWDRLEIDENDRL